MNDDAPDTSTKPDDATTAEEEREAHAAHQADPPDEAASEAAPTGPVSDSVSKAEKESMETGANVKGEGQID